MSRPRSKTVHAAGRGLYALVNNAGVGGIGPIASFTDDEVRELFEINVLGVVRMTRTFLPLVLESAGRVVVVGSMGGSIAMYGTERIPKTRRPRRDQPT
ncbi:MAG: SDR family NAD(P)-dependent oxidoreductase, partial [Candidatus Eisenbacteria bacterium]|nr:SDR family NAD(P)-dependent oxidoreductase [Candidatus Eisenbacteria bacterium]